MSYPKKIKKSTSAVRYVIVSSEYAEQRIDNFLVRYLKNVPKSHIYRILRKGEVRVNKKRISAFYRLIEGDSVRLPPLFLDHQAKQVPPSQETVHRLSSRILYEDDNFLIINNQNLLWFVTCFDYYHFVSL